MNLKQLINASGGSGRCASIWGITIQSVSNIIKRNSISKGLLKELAEYHAKQVGDIASIYTGDTEVDFMVVDRKSNRRKK